VTSVWPQKRQPALVLGVLGYPHRDAARVLSVDWSSVVPPARSLIPYRPWWRQYTLQGSWLDKKGAQRTGKVAGARPDDARWRSRRRLEQFSVNEYYREEVFSVVLIERIAPVRGIRCYGARQMS
jgi:hypothetical protein